MERNWETWETAYLVRNGHRMPLEEVAARLGRSEASVKAKATRLRKAGRDVGPLRKCGTVAVVCWKCGLPRYLVGRNGMCGVCAARARLEMAERDLARLGVPPADAGRGRMPGNLPEPDRGEAAAHEAWEILMIDRRTAAVKKRASRAAGNDGDSV